jgi:Fe-S cluster assembly protein SufD
MSALPSPLLDCLLRAEPLEDALIAQRQHSHDQLQRLGLPSARDEAWRYSALRTLSSKAFALRDDAAHRRELPETLRSRIAATALRLVFVNGVLRRELSTLEALPEGLSIDAKIHAVQGVIATTSTDAFIAANQALAQVGASVEVAANAVVAAALHIFYVALHTEASTAFHTRLSIRLAAGAQCALIEEHHVDAAASHLCNRIIECDLGAGARLTHTRLFNIAPSANSIHTSHYRLGAAATVETFELTPGQSLSRHQVDVELIGDGARFVSGGVQALSGRTHADVQVSVHHRARDTACDLIWRGIADQRARLGFTGNLQVAVGADGSDAKLSSKNLLLSAHAEVNTRPVLVIHADEVKAAHGATVGQLDERALFYLRSRGIARARARVMLTHAFAIEALQALSDESLRTQMALALRWVMAGFIGDDSDAR